MTDGTSPDKPVPTPTETASDASTAPTAPPIDNSGVATPTSLEELAGAPPTHDIPADEVTVAQDQRRQAFLDLLPNLARYGIVFNPRDSRWGNSPVVLLYEPAGGSHRKDQRYIAVSERGAQLAGIGTPDDTEYITQFPTLILARKMVPTSPWDQQETQLH